MCLGIDLKITLSILAALAPRQDGDALPGARARLIIAG